MSKKNRQQPPAPAPEPKPQDGQGGDTVVSKDAVAGPWKPLSACFMRVEEHAAARAAGIDPEKATFTYTPETRDGIEGVAMSVEEA